MEGSLDLSITRETPLDLSITRSREEPLNLSIKKAAAAVVGGSENPLPLGPFQAPRPPTNQPVIQDDESVDFIPPLPPGPPPRTPSPPPPPPATATPTQHKEKNKRKKKQRRHNPKAKDPRLPSTSAWSPSGEEEAKDTSDQESDDDEVVWSGSDGLPRPIKMESVPDKLPPLPDQITGFDASQYYIIKSRPAINFRGVVTESAFNLQMVQDVGAEDEPLLRMQRVQAVLSHAFHQVLRRAQPGSIGQVFVENDKLYNKVKPTERKPVEEMSFEDVAKVIVEAEQSPKEGEDGEDSSVQLEETTFTLVTFLPKPNNSVGAIPKGMYARNEVSMMEYVRKSKCFMDPMPKWIRLPKDMEHMCVPLCVTLALKMQQLEIQPRAIEDPMRKYKYAELVKYKKSKQLREDAKNLVQEAELKPALGPFKVYQIKKIQQRLGDAYQINIFSAPKPPDHKFGKDSAPNQINLLIREDIVPSPKENQSHAVLITSMGAFFGKLRKYCQVCKKTSHRKANHRCLEAKCIHCKIVECQSRITKKLVRPYKLCDACNRTFMTKECYDVHKKRRICENFAKCKLCQEFFNKTQLERHQCGKRLCQHCKVRHLPTTYCFLRPAPGKHSENHPHNTTTNGGEEEEEEVDEEEQESEPQQKEQDLARLKEYCVWYGDAETQVDPDTLEHNANLLILQRPRPDKGPGEYDEKVYKGPMAMRLFTQDCIKENSPYANSFVVFHNAGGFDAHLWLRELMILDCPPKNPIFKGERILAFTLRQNNIKLRDSLQFIPGTPLAKFPDMFDLACGPKGEFPHLLNTPAWVDFENPEPYCEDDEEGNTHTFPLLHYFHPDNKRPRQLQALKAWHSEQVTKYQQTPHLTYIPSKELEEYCRQDVRILREGFEKYRGTWKKQFPDMEPLYNLTFPSYNNALFRTKYMKKDSIALLPPEGFTKKNRPQSKECHAWMSLEQKKATLAGRPFKHFRHARSGYEVSIGGISVDGFGVDQNGEQHVYQFHGCWWHGCSCTPDSPGTSGVFKLQRRLHYDNTLKNDAFLQDLSQSPESPYGPFHCHVIWGCEWEALAGRRAQDGAMEKEYRKAFIAAWPKDRLKPRDAFKGARTNAIKHCIPRVDKKRGWSLKYLDYTSLYPSVNFSMEDQQWPLGPPDIYLGSEIGEFGAPVLEQAFGLWKVDILPPKHLRHPVLGQSINAKLIFHLCTSCAMESLEGPCEHEDPERLIKSGTFFTEELKLAVEMGYVIEKVYEIWDWPEDRRTVDMFRDLIRDQYVKKVTASGPPPTEAELQTIIRDHKESMGLVLEPHQFVKNKALRSLAKFSLNNIWGYLGKREDYTTTEFLDDLEEVNKLEHDDSVEITSIRIVMDGHLLKVQHKPKEETASKNGNIVLALMTTAYARIELYKVIREYVEEVVYFDTDSVILHIPPGVAPPTTSSRLGGLKDEILEEYGPAAYMSSFASLGPKTYTYSVRDGRSGATLAKPLKVKGFSLTAQACSVLTPNLIHAMVQDRERVEDVQQFQIGRNTSHGLLFNRHLIKRFAFSSSKRWFLPAPNPYLDTRPFGYTPTNYGEEEEEESE